MVVPGHEPRAQSVHLSQERVRLVLAVPDAIVAQALDVLSDVFSNRLLGRVALIDVVAQKDYEVDVVLGHVPVGVVVSVLVVLTRGEGEP